jgi:predicted transcriptional regulator
MIEKGRPSAVVVAFNVRLLEDVKDSSFSAIIRRRVPASTPDFLYFHVKAPISGIVGRARVIAVRRVSSKEAVVLAPRLKMLAAEVADYVGERKSVGIYEIADVKLFERPLHTDQLRAGFPYHPPQNFIRLSGDAVGFIERSR